MCCVRKKKIQLADCIITDELDVDIITKYAAKCSPVITGLEGRITIITSIDEEDKGKEETEENTSSDVTVNPQETTTNTDSPQTSTEARESNIFTDITSGFNRMGSEMRKAGKELGKIPKSIPIIGKRR